MLVSGYQSGRRLCMRAGVGILSPSPARRLDVRAAIRGTARDPDV